jgi:hypothetical protein
MISLCRYQLAGQFHRGHYREPEGVMSMSERQEERTEDLIKVRQVTHIQASWTEEERGGPGAFTLQLILDNGADEYVLRPAASDIEALLRLFRRSESAMFDLERKVLMFNNLSID